MNRTVSLFITCVISFTAVAVAADKKTPTTGPVGFSSYVERVPKTLVKIEMFPIPGGKFVFSPDGKESPREVEIKPFWMSKTEITWRQYETWYLQLDQPEKDRKLYKDFDAIARPSQPYGVPDHGWGRDERPVLHTTYYAGDKY